MRVGGRGVTRPHDSDSLEDVKRRPGLTGPAHRVRHPAELHRLQEDAVIWPWPGGEREVYVRIIPSQITGRRIEIRLYR